MECPANVTIKEEKVEFSFEHEGLQNVHFDVNVKIENFALLGNVDWCVENAALLEEIDKKFHETVSDEKPWLTCQMCGQFCTDSHSLFKHNLQHLKVMVVKSTIYQCNFCTISYTQKNKLKDHIVKRHTETKKNITYSVSSGVLISKSKHMCEICHKVLPYKTWYGHMREVHANSPVECSKCSKVFKSHVYLRRHKMYVHDGVRPSWRGMAKSRRIYHVMNVKKRFLIKNALKVHKRDSHSTRQFHCYICKSVLKCKTYLMAHMRRVHYFDGKEHSCDICGKKFKSPRYVNVHIKNAHAQKKNVSQHNVES